MKRKDMVIMNEMVGYIRCSTDKQNLDRQEETMKNLGITNVYREKKTAKDNDRDELKKLLEHLRQGDTLVVDEITRLARNIRGLLEIVDILKEKNVKFKSVKENIDTTTPQGEFMLSVFGALAELERKALLQRQAEGIKQAKLQGKYKGRKPKEMKNFNIVYQNWLTNKLTAMDAAKMLNVGISTFYRKAREIEQPKK